MDIAKEELIESIVEFSKAPGEYLFSEVVIRSNNFTKLDIFELQKRFKVKSFKFGRKQFVEIYISDQIKIVQHFNNG